MTAHDARSSATNFMPKRRQEAVYASNVSNASSIYSDDLDIDRIVDIHSGNMKVELQRNLEDLRSEEEHETKRELKEMATQLADTKSRSNRNEDKLKAANLRMRGLEEKVSVMEDEMVALNDEAAKVSVMKEEMDALKEEAAKVSLLENQVKDYKLRFAYLSDALKHD